MTVATICVALALGLSACGSDDPAPTRKSVATTTVTTMSTEGADAAARVCSQVITSAAVMIRDYNTFITKLNRTQDYANVTTEARYARDTLDTGADLIRKANSPQVPKDLDDKVQKFLTSTDELSEQIDQKRKQALNRTTTEWGDRRTAVVDACGEFLPTGA
ncbi:MAG: hypothetical protein QM658_11385 [Gordonia sp. (in: high G+C Gram-positive bacteria)]